MSIKSTPEILERLVSMRSVFTDDDYQEITDFAADFLRGYGFTCHRLAGTRAGRAGLFASLGPAGPGGVLLSAHLDVVPVDGQDWTVDPFRMTRRHGRLYGRGTTDMKGFAAAALAAAARASTMPLKAPLKIAFSYDEEAGCVGMAEMIDSLDETVGLPDYCIVGEPTSMQVATGHKGKRSYLMRFKGTPAHSASAPVYVNALHIATDAVVILRRLQADLAERGARDEAYDVPYSTVHVGRMSGGTALNIVPDAAELEFEIRHLAAEDASLLIDGLRQDIDCTIDRWRRVHPDARATIEHVNSYPGIESGSDADVTQFAIKLGGRGPATKVSYGTEAGFFKERWGIPTIVCGPGDMTQGHKPDEFVEESQLIECDTMLNNLLTYLSR